MWQTKMICTFVAASVPVEKAGDVNPLLEAANQVGIDKSDEEKQAEPAAQSGPQVGSYERFMSTFGNPARWAGRS